MAEKQVILQFRFANFGESMLQKMDALRSQRRFCDVLVRINDLEVAGHKVVFAAGSPFLRDQFFLQDSAEIQISTLQDAEVGQKLLLSCYTGVLEFPELELVNYLTVASFLQMGHIVEQCTQALNKFIKPHQVKDEQTTQTHSSKVGQFLPTVEAEQNELENQVVDEGEEDDDDDIIIERVMPSGTQNMEGRTRTKQSKNSEECDNSPLAIIKVESVRDKMADSMRDRISQSPTLNSPEPQHSLINSTVENRVGDSETTLMHLSDYPTSPVPAESSRVWGGLRTNEKGIQWYHQCPKCSRVFRQLENYANHLKMHKLFMCLLCGKTFTQKGNLHRHMRVHAGIKPFQCKICGKNFTQKCSLLDHLNLHSGDKPHRCNYCEMVFAHKPVLRKHLKQVHGKNSFDNANEGCMQELEFSGLQESSTENRTDQLVSETRQYAVNLQH
ncbi:zinc finger and BTB domain-containing protein 26 [Alosa sapidissima]|uniref:zinc finger and BTB domain-containing protein 26 n=1 Tax=Alosa sapidissima TaxID=34773 RepID=UPI001C08AA80|nr:zinc finger and BTB domain-containing protein 26 [Alosa sapidissima]XP_041926487.1 zinc finger and BTB domain-containing protein 26 [Alosa sapidissima]XP_041926488.1 zinc finger and BTB domain-containing protein 26 [Alosa sapidissima]XP_041926490.1 zinc finger and BTB domain-containing protein 26 [Alosa sapidissima]